MHGDSRSRSKASSDPATSAAWCYTYDGVNRLKTAKTGRPGSGTGCTAPTSEGQTAPVVGTNYDLSFTYDKTRLKEVISTGGKTATYDYPTSGTRPHAATSTAIGGTDSTVGLPTPATLTYDDAGRAKTQSVTGGASYDFSYDATGNLIKADDTTGGVDIEHAYDADGIRLARKAGNETTLYVAGGEITNPGSGTVTARRTFTAPDGIPQRHCWQPAARAGAVGRRARSTVCQALG